MRMAGSKYSTDASETKYDSTLELEYPMPMKPFKILNNFPWMKFGMDEKLLPDMTLGQKQAVQSNEGKEEGGAVSNATENLGDH